MTGKIFVFSGPSGVGKNTIMAKLQELFPDMRYMVSATTRPKRDGEVDGTTYHFLSQEEFERRITEGDFFEYEEVHGNYYGTLSSELEQACHVMGDIDVNGAKRIKEAHGERVVTIFIMPPSPEELHERLRTRGENDESIAKRLERMEMEISLSETFDHLIVNDVLEEALNEIVRIVEGS